MSWLLLNSNRKMRLLKKRLRTFALDRLKGDFLPNRKRSLSLLCRHFQTKKYR